MKTGKKHPLLFRCSFPAAFCLCCASFFTLDARELKFPLQHIQDWNTPVSLESGWRHTWWITTEEIDPATYRHPGEPRGDSSGLIWEPLEVPGGPPERIEFENADTLWFRKSFYYDEGARPGADPLLHIRPQVGAKVFFNGVERDSTGYDAYAIGRPRPGINVILIRLERSFWSRSEIQGMVELRPLEERPNKIEWKFLLAPGALFLTGIVLLGLWHGYRLHWTLAAFAVFLLLGPLARLLTWLIIYFFAHGAAVALINFLFRSLAVIGFLLFLRFYTVQERNPALVLLDFLLILGGLLFLSGEFLISFPIFNESLSLLFFLGRYLLVFAVGMKGVADVERSNWTGLLLTGGALGAVFQDRLTIWTMEWSMDAHLSYMMYRPVATAAYSIVLGIVVALYSFKESRPEGTPHES